MAEKNINETKWAVGSRVHHSKDEKKENWTNTMKNKQEKPGLQFHEELQWPEHSNENT